MMVLMMMIMEDNAHHGSRPLYGEFSKRQTTALPVRRPNNLLFLFFKMISCLESESPIFSQYDSHYIKNMKWCGNLYIKLGLPLVSQLEEQQGQIVKTHQAEEKMIVKKKRERKITDGCISSWQLTYRGTRKRIGRGRCTAAFDAAPSAFERELVRILGQKSSFWQKKIIVTKKGYCDKKKIIVTKNVKDKHVMTRNMYLTP